MFDEGDDLGGIDTFVAQGDLVEELAEGHFIVLCGRIFGWEDPGLFDDGLEEETAELHNDFDEALPFKLGRVQQFGFAEDGVEGIILDAEVVCWQHDGKAVKGMAPFAKVLGVGVKKAR